MRSAETFSASISATFPTPFAKNEDGSSAVVPGLILETRDDVRRCLESIKRRELKRHYEEQLDNAHTKFSVERELHTLEGHRCRVAEGLGLG